MIEPPRETLTELAYLPRPGTPERREWNVTIRQADELYPDWIAIRIGQSRLRREVYEKQYREHGRKRRPWFRQAGSSPVPEPAGSRRPRRLSARPTRGNMLLSQGGRR